MSRKHSSGMTLDAVSASKQGKQPRSSMIKLLFPSAQKMTAKYPYLKKHPWLLPAAWVSRLINYTKETGRVKDNSMADSLRIGKERIEMLKKYRIIR